MPSPRRFIRCCTSCRHDNVATKLDLERIEAALKADLARVEAALTIDLAAVRAELQGVEQRLDHKINTMVNRIVAASCPLPCGPANVPSPDRQRALGLGGGNRSSCPNTGRDEGRGFRAPQAAPANRSPSTLYDGTGSRNT
jgi:hypothetical protein